MNILVTGGAGYIGARLVPMLLADGHKVTSLDTEWFGHGYLPKDNENLTVINGDVRDYAFADYDTVIWLASISNNAMYGVNYDLTHAVNTYVKRGSAPKFLYASSVAVLDPTSDYAKDKLACEAQLKDSGAIIVRAASACGYSAHQRFDLTLNMMTHDAYRKGVITVNGGEQVRWHVHIDDLCEFYRLALKKAVDGETYSVFNIGTRIKDAANIIADIFENHKRPISIDLKPRSDDRDYPLLDGDSMRSIGYENKRAVWDGVRDLMHRFDAGQWPDSMTNPIYQNINATIR